MDGLRKLIPCLTTTTRGTIAGLAGSRPERSPPLAATSTWTRTRTRSRSRLPSACSASDRRPHFRATTRRSASWTRLRQLHAFEDVESERKRYALDAPPRRDHQCLSRRRHVRSRARTRRIARRRAATSGRRNSATRSRRWTIPPVTSGSPKAPGQPGFPARRAASRFRCERVGYATRRRRRERAGILARHKRELARGD